MLVVVIAAVAVSSLWLRDRTTETCPDVGPPADVSTAVTVRDNWRLADVPVGDRHYNISPSVNADFGAYVRPIPLPETHPVSVGLTIQSRDQDEVNAWRTSCIRVTYGRESISRRASIGNIVLTSGDGTFHYRFDGARGFPEWPPQAMVDVRVTFIVDGSPFVIDIPSVPIVPMG